MEWEEVTLHLAPRFHRSGYNTFVELEARLEADPVAEVLNEDVVSLTRIAQERFLRDFPKETTAANVNTVSLYVGSFNDELLLLDLGEDIDDIVSWARGYGYGVAPGNYNPSSVPEQILYQLSDNILHLRRQAIHQPFEDLSGIDDPIVASFYQHPNIRDSIVLAVYLPDARESSLDNLVDEFDGCEMNTADVNYPEISYYGPWCRSSFCFGRAMIKLARIVDDHAPILLTHTYDSQYQVEQVLPWLATHHRFLQFD